MTIPNPEHLFDQALKLAERPAKGAPRQVDIRRALSAAYYGAFHFVLQRVADEFIGTTAQARQSPAYALVYRSIDHRTLSDLCESIQKSKLPDKLVWFAPQGGFAPSVKEFAAALVELQEKRYRADYDPSAKFKRLDAVSMVATARSAIVAFNSADLLHQRAFVALLAFKKR